MTEKTALQEPRVAIVDNVSGDVVNVIVADSVEWVQQKICKDGQTAYDVSGLPVSNRWKSEPGDDGEWFKEVNIEDPETKEKIPAYSVLDYEEDGQTPKASSTGWAQVKLVPVSESTINK